MKYTITIPNWQPTKINQLLTNYWVAARFKKADYEMIWAYSRHISPATTKRSVRPTIRITGRGRTADPDSYHKSLLDALVRTKMLVDDSQDWVETLKIEIIRGDKKETIIELVDIPTVKKLPKGYAIGSVQPKYVRSSKKGVKSD